MIREGCKINAGFHGGQTVFLFKPYYFPKTHGQKMKSFTLIELIVVIAIIAVLAAIIAPNAFKAIEKAKISQMVSDMKSVKTAFLAMYTDVGIFPVDADYGGNPTLEQTDLMRSVLYTQAMGWDGPYLEKTPRNPFGGIYRYDNDNDCYSAPRVSGGVNIFFRCSESNLDADQLSSLFNRIDAAVDSSDGLEQGIFRVDGATAVLYLIYSNCQ